MSHTPQKAFHATDSRFYEQLGITPGVELFEEGEQGRAVVPRGVIRGVDDIVAEAQEPRAHLSTPFAGSSAAW